MKYVKLHSNSYVVMTSKGMKPFDKHHLNFSKLVEAITSNASEETVLELLKNPPTPNGVYSAYHHTKTEELIYSITTDKGTNYYNLDKSTPEDTSFVEFLGSYVSLKDLYEDNPSYLI